MRAIKYREMKLAYDKLGPARCVKHLSEALKNGELKAKDFSLREVAEVCMGREWVKALDPRSDSGFRLLEGDAVDSTAFSNITGQIVFSKILEGYQSPAFWASATVQTIPTRLSGEKFPGIDPLKDEALVVNEGMPYPTFGFGENYIETPTTTKRGEIIAITKEAIFFDLTGLVLQRAGQVGEVLGLNKEKRVLDMCLGTATTFATGGKYKWKGTEYDVFQSTQWDNTATDELVDWTDVDSVEQLFANMLDPVTSEPIIINPASMTMVVMPAYRHAARRILNATETKYGADSGTVQTMAANTLNRYQLQDATELAYRRIIASGVAAADAKKYWYLGDFGRAFAYMENWPITVVQAPTNSEAEFVQDVVVRYRASERGTPAVMDPRYVCRSTGAG